MKNDITRTLWGARGLDAWYYGPSFDNYRCCKFCAPETRPIQINSSYDFFPQLCIMPSFTQEQHTMEVNKELKDATINWSKKARSKLVQAIKRH